MDMKIIRCKMGMGYLIYFTIRVFWGSESLAMSSQDIRASTVSLNPQINETSSIPTIDRRVPVVFETASFGLG
jgi:hypothetical protein